LPTKLEGCLYVSPVARHSVRTKIKSRGQKCHMYALSKDFVWHKLISRIYGFFNNVDFIVFWNKPHKWPERRIRNLFDILHRSFGVHVERVYSIFLRALKSVYLHFQEYY
jgi:hypothetical protein